MTKIKEGPAMEKLHSHIRFFVFTLILSLCTCPISGTYAETGNAAYSIPFLWNSHTLRVTYALDNETVNSGHAAAGEKSVQVFLESMDDTLSWDEVTSCGPDFSLWDSERTEYNVVVCGFQAEEGSSRNIADLASNRYVGFSPIFDVPEGSGFDALTLVVKNGETSEAITISLAGVPSEVSTDAEAIPEELVGAWSGTGTPVGGGSDISLDIIVNANGIGVYTFEQAGYMESYPFTLESDSERFSVSIPAGNQLGIAACEGTYSYANGILTLRITTSFSSGRQYEYVADCVKAAESSEIGS
jgi:hypothetical protein